MFFRKLRRALAAVEDLFVGTAYADMTLPAGIGVKFLHGDHLGSVNLITDHTGAKVELDEYSPFGSFSRREDPFVVSLSNPERISALE